MADVQSRLQRNYAELEAATGTVNNTAGVANVAATDAFLCESLAIDSDQPENERPDKTGVLGLVAGTAGRKTSSWSMRCSLAGSGAAGTAPDIDVFLRALMGQAGVVSAGVSVTYERGETGAPPTLTLWDFNALATGEQRALAGAVVQRARFDIGGNFGMVEFSGQGKSLITSNGFATLDTPSKCSLTAFPAEPASRTIAGSSVQGYKGTITLDGNTYTTLRTGYVEIVYARELPGDAFNSDLPGNPSDGRVAVTVGLNMYDDDSANFSALKVKAQNKSALVDFAFVIGTVAGNIWTFTIKNVRLNTPRIDYGNTKRVVDFGTSPAHITSATAKDDFKVVLT